MDKEILNLKLRTQNKKLLTKLKQTCDIQQSLIDKIQNSKIDLIKKGFQIDKMASFECINDFFSSNSSLQISLYIKVSPIKDQAFTYSVFSFNRRNVDRWKHLEGNTIESFEIPSFQDMEFITFRISIDKQSLITYQLIYFDQIIDLKATIGSTINNDYFLSISFIEFKGKGDQTSS